MSAEATPVVPAAAEQVLGGAVPEVKAAVPAVEQPKVEANAAGTAPATGQTQAAANEAKQAAETKKVEDAKKALDETKAAKDKEVADAQAADKLWSEFKFKPPEGQKLDDAQMKKFVPLARELGLKPEQAQKLVDFQGEAAKAQLTAANVFADQQRGQQLASLKSEHGEGWDAALRTANKAVDKFGSPELKKFLGEMRLDANPHLFKIFHTIGKAMQDDRIADGAGLGGKAPKKSLESLYTHPTSQRR